MITFIRLINISINVALKSLYSVSVIPHWGVYTERSHPDALLRELSAGRSFRVWSVQKIAPLKGMPFLEFLTSGSHRCVEERSGHFGPMQSCMWSRVVHWTGHGSVLSVFLSIHSSFPCHFHKCWSLFCTPTQLQCGHPENPVCDTFIQLDLIRFFRYMMQK